MHREPQTIVGHFLHLYRDKWMDLKNFEREQSGARIYIIYLEKNLPEHIRKRVRALRGIADENG